MLNQKAALNLREAMLHMVCSVRGIVMMAAMSSVLIACGGDSTASGSSQVASNQTQSPTVVSDNTSVVANSPSAPTLRFVSPANNQGFTVVDDFSVEVVAQDDGSIQNVSLFVDGQLIRYENFAPYIWGSANDVAYARQIDSAAFNSQLSGGDHQLTAVAVDDQGLSSQVSIMVSVSEPAAPTPSTPPSTSGGNVTTAPDSVFASRTFGVAPLSVHFDSGYEGDDFHNYQFDWDFGDSGAGVNVHNGLNKNVDTGPIAGHLYENPGTYNASLTIRDASGIVNTHNIEIVVTDTNLAYSGFATKCISKTTDFSGCPSGAQQLTVSDSQIDSQLVASNIRILLRRGDSWDVQGVSSSVISGLYIGAYGNCISADARGICSNAPVIRSVGNSFPASIDFRKGSKNIIIEDIHVTAASSSNTHSINLFTLENLILNRVKGTVVSPLVGEGMHDSGIYNSDFSGGTVTLYVDGKKMVMKNNTFHDSVRSHVVRLPIARKLVFTHNEVHSSTIGVPAGTGAGLLVKLHSLHEGDLCNIPNDNRSDWCNRFVRGGEPRYSTEYVYMANNLFGRGSNWGVDLLAQNGAYAEKLENVIVEKNLWDMRYGNPEANSGNQSIQLQMQATNGTIRNNIIDIEGVTTTAPGSGYNWPIRIPNWNPHFPSDGVKIYNNTINTNGQNFSTNWAGIRVESNQRNTDIRNNLIVSPTSDSNDVGVEDLGIATLQSNNLYTASPGFEDVSGFPVDSNYMLRPGSPALNIGDSSTLILDSYDGVLRGTSSVGNIDIGAYEQ